MYQWPEYGDPSTKCRLRLGGIMCRHEGAAYGIAEALLAEVTRIETTCPLKLLALAGAAINQPATSPSAASKLDWGHRVRQESQSLRLTSDAALSQLTVIH